MIANKWVSGRVIIAKMYNDYNILSTDFEESVPQYINDAYGDMTISYHLKKKHCSIPIIDYEVQLPCHIKLLNAVELNGCRLEKDQSRDDTNKNTEMNYGFVGYTEIGNNKIKINNLAVGTVIVYYTELPITWDKELNKWMPLVHDNIIIQEAICLYILKRMMLRGYVHSILSLSSNNPMTNVGILYEIGKKKARNQTWVIDSDTRHNIYKVLANMFNNPDDYSNGMFNELQS